MEIADDARGTLRLDSFALYYVCEDIDGVCQFLRQDVPVEIEILAPTQ